MTFARTVRLLVALLLVAGFGTTRPSLYAQTRADTRQYDPAYDGAALPDINDDWGAVPAYVSAISGAAQLYRAGDTTSEFEQVPLEVGDQLRTTRGRIEVLFSDGSVVALDEYSTITVDQESVWRLHSGRVKVVSRDSGFAVDAAPVGVAQLRSGGEYRITMAVNRRGESELEVAVSRGSAELENRLGRTLVRQGTRALTTEAFAPSVPYAYSAPRDEFERWTESLEADRYGVESARYLPVELRSYGGYFDRDGSWSHHHDHGWVWYPRVSVGWQPFHSGRWSFVIGFGYNWIGGSRWEWPTHHYGRWDRYGSRWYWVPSRPIHVRRVGYSAPRRSYNVSVSYYSRPVTSRPSYSSRGNTNFRGNPDSRSRIIESSRDDRRPSGTWSNPQPRVAVPRSSPTSRDSRPSANPTQPSSRQDNPVFRQRPEAGTSDRRVTRPDSEPPQVVRPQPPGRGERPSARPRSPEPERPSDRQPQTSQSSRSGSRQPSSAGRAPDTGSGPSARQPSGGRTPSSSARPPSGTAVRRGGGGR